MTPIKLKHLDNSRSLAPVSYLVDNFPGPQIITYSVSVARNYPRRELRQELEKIGYTVLQWNARETEYPDDIYIHPDKQIVLGCYRHTCRITRTREDQSIDELLAILNKWPETVEANRIHLLTYQGGFDLFPFEGNKVKLDLETDYETNFPLAKVSDLLETSSPGLILLCSSLPGTGKTYFIRHLYNTMKKKFVFLPNNLVSSLTDPKFLRFALEELTDSVLVIEDAEMALIDRRKAANDAASVLLNVCDGILGDILGLKIIATINNEENIDRALLRKGRLLAKIDFQKLPVKKADQVRQRLGGTVPITEPSPLCEVYNQADISFLNESKPVGFRFLGKEED